MNTIIQCFLEKIISLEEKSLENLNNINFLSDLIDDINLELMNLGKELILNYLNNLEKIIFNSYEKKENKKRKNIFCSIVYFFVLVYTIHGINLLEK